MREMASKLTKLELRRCVRSMIQSLPPNERSAQSAEVCRILWGDFIERVVNRSNNARLLLFISTPHELSLEPLFATVFEKAQCVDVFVPWVYSASHRDMVFVEVKSKPDLDMNFVPQGRWQLRELIPEEQEEIRSAVDSSRVGHQVEEGRRKWIAFRSKNGVDELIGENTTPTIIVVPGVAYNRNKSRLGKGGGFYDRFLSSLRRSQSNTFAIGVGFSKQLIDEPIPEEPWDQSVDEIVIGSSLNDVCLK